VAETNVLGLLFILLLIGAALAVLFWVGTLWFQGYIYNEPAGELYWRAPAAAAALTVFLGLMCFLTYRHLGNIDPLEFSARQDQRFDQFWAVEKGGKKVLYRRRGAGSLLSGTEYVAADSQPSRPWKRTDSESRLFDAIVVQEGPDKKEVKFKLRQPEGGKFREGEQAVYAEEGGRRVMTENNIGEVSTTRGWLVVAYLLLNVLHFVVWFACLWLLLRFQWSHALGLAFVFWLIATFAIVPMVLRRAEQAAPPPATPATSSPARSASKGTQHPLLALWAGEESNHLPHPVARTCMMSPSCTM
jgi:hypothetical protein